MRSLALTGAGSWLILRRNRPSHLHCAGFVRKRTSRETTVVAPSSKPFRSEKKRSTPSHWTAPQTSADQTSGTPENLDESSALSSLKKLIAAGDHRLDPLLETIADAARRLTGASGAALAMWKDGAMLCRARSGKTAPALGARLSADTGIRSDLAHHDVPSGSPLRQPFGAGHSHL